MITSRFEFNASKKSRKAGGELDRISIREGEFADSEKPESVLALDDALTKFENLHPRKAALVKLRYFGGLTIEQAAEALDVAQSTAIADWSYAKGWLKLEISKNL